MVDIIIALIIIAIVGASITKIIIEKKKGAKCIGCPSSGKSSCGCNEHK
ncbi:MAG: FeoB-associated Cys-rich membrane protein [Anaerocolumna sp.]